MDLPKLYRPVQLRFWTHRCGIGSSGGVIFDVDEQVTRKCMRVIGKGGRWHWQICGISKLIKWFDCEAILDQDILKEIGNGKGYSEPFEVLSSF